MRPLALFDLDRTLLDYGGAISVWADEFVARWDLAVKWSAYLVFAVWYHQGSMEELFGDIRDEFDVAESPLGKIRGARLDALVDGWCGRRSRRGKARPGSVPIGGTTLRIPVS